MRGRLYFRPGIRQLDLFIRFRGNPTPGFLPRLLVRNFGRLPANSLTNFKFLPLRRPISESPDLRISGTQPRISSPIVRSYNVSLVRAKEKGATFFSSLSFFFVNFQFRWKKFDHAEHAYSPSPEQERKFERRSMGARFGKSVTNAGVRATRRGRKRERERRPTLYAARCSSRRASRPGFARGRRMSRDLLIKVAVERRLERHRCRSSLVRERKKESGTDR